MTETETTTHISGVGTVPMFVFRDPDGNRLVIVERPLDV